MNGDTATFNLPNNASARKNILSSVNFSFFTGKFLFFARLAGVFSFGCFLLLSLFVLQIAALEISDRLSIFPLFGFFTLNIVCGLFFIGFYFTSRRFAARFNQDAAQTAQVSPNRFSQFWSRLISGLSVREAKAQTQTANKPVAVLLIIKRQASEEAKPKSRAASA
jgi:hypothetical protein